ncbi:MAG: ATP-binding protein [Clostridiaceae bacterium]
MRINNGDMQEEMNTILFSLKSAILLFICIIVYQCLPDYFLDLKNKYGYINEKYIFALLSSFLLICLVWVIINIFSTNRKNKNTKFFSIELIFYVLIIILPICLFHAYQKEFKYIFLLVIIIATIQYGIRCGVITSFVCGISILGIDLIYAPIVDGTNIYFENDLILVGVFIFVAWILGYYVEIVNNNNNKKEKQLSLLSDELEIQYSKRDKIEKLLLKNKMCFDMLFENAENAIIVHKDGEIIYSNERTAKLLKYKEVSKIDEKTIYNWYDEENIKQVRKKYSKIINEKVSKVVEEETIFNANGDPITVRNTSLFFVYEGEPSVLTFFLDITNEKQLEVLKSNAKENLKLLNETREFNILITEFFINISHEIKTPINIIYIVIQSLEMYFNNYNVENKEKCKEYLKIMKQNCFRMIRLVNNILDITKFNSGSMRFNKKNHNIVSVVEDIAQSTAVYIQTKNIRLIFDTNVEEKIMAFDDDKLERIILNLLSNAFKYTPAGGEIKVDLEDKGSNVIISVKNEGKGIPEEDFEIIFERFGQANRSLSREYEGSGIGLYLVKSFVEMHNGEITVNSKEGKETEFKIVLPVEVMNDDDEYKKDISSDINIDRINIEFSDIYDID